MILGSITTQQKTIQRKSRKLILVNMPQKRQHLLTIITMKGVERSRANMIHNYETCSEMILNKNDSTGVLFQNHNAPAHRCIIASRNIFKLDTLHHFIYSPHFAHSDYITFRLQRLSLKQTPIQLRIYKYIIFEEKLSFQTHLV